MIKQKTCASCGKLFTPWRKKEFCSERCRKRAENRRLGTTLADSQNLEKIDQQNQQEAGVVRGDEGPAFIVRQAEWIAINEITHKLSHNSRAIGWVIYIERGKGWFGRVRDNRGEWSFGPCRVERAKDAVEAWIKQEPFEKRENEKSWRDDCLAVL